MPDITDHILRATPRRGVFQPVREPMRWYHHLAATVIAIAAVVLAIGFAAVTR